METVTDCRSDEGITVGLVDAMISIARILAKRDLNHKKEFSISVQESLIDFIDDPDVKFIIRWAKHCKKFRHTS